MAVVVSDCKSSLCESCRWMIVDLDDPERSIRLSHCSNDKGLINWNAPTLDCKGYERVSE